MQAMENEEKRMAQFAEEKERKMRLRAEREAGEQPGGPATGGDAGLLG